MLRVLNTASRTCSCPGFDPPLPTELEQLDSLDADAKGRFVYVRPEERVPEWYSDFLLLGDVS